MEAHGPTHVVRYTSYVVRSWLKSVDVMESKIKILLQEDEIVKMNNLYKKIILWTKDHMTIF